MRRFSLLLIVSLAFAGEAGAADYSYFYSDALLTEWQGRYEPNIRWNFDNLIIRNLTSPERRQLGRIELVVPLRPASPGQGDPMAYYARGDEVVIPVQSVRFLDELSLAWAYAQLKQLELEKVTNYIAMLKYKEPSRGARHPAPLDAFGLPGDIWKQDEQVDELSQKILKSALVWIMAHEVGHLFHKHRGYDPETTARQSQENEAEADRFANEIMRRVGEAPLGMVPFFMAMAHWAALPTDFASEAEWNRFVTTEATHPFTAERLRALAADLKSTPDYYFAEQPDRERAVRDILAVAAQIDQIAAFLSDPDIHLTIDAVGRTTTPDSVKLILALAPTRSAEPFQGTYSGTWVHLLRDGDEGDEEVLDMTLDLTRTGQRVTGSFDFGLGPGSITGFVRNDTLYFEWSWLDNFGQGQLRGASRLEGRIGYRDSDEGAGTWTLER